MNRDLEVDVIVVGGGITGLTAAYLLKRAGATVALIERDRIGGVDTSSTTAHLTHVTDQRPTQLVKRFGRDGARAAWEAGQAAIDQIVAIIRELRIDCRFRWVPGYLHLPADQKGGRGRRKLQDDAELATAMGFRADYQAEIPYFGVAGVRFSHQALFHPLEYAAAIARAIPGDGSHVFENTAAAEISDEPLTVNVGEHAIRGGYLVIATHTPLVGVGSVLKATLFQTKLYLYTSYAVGAEVPPGMVPEASYWDTADPYRYLRVERGDSADYAILGGEDHKTGQTDDPEEHYASLASLLERLIPGARVDHRWSGQVIETPDGLPYIGETHERQFISTGYAGNGMTFGTLGAMMALDAYQGRDNPWRRLFDPKRKKLAGAAFTYLRENSDYPFHLVRDRLARAEGDSLESVPRREGRILNLDGRKVAAYRDELGTMTLRSPVCTHLGCIVAWNDAEQTWDCPCHGSRFGPTGSVISGPAEEDLKPHEPKADG